MQCSSGICGTVVVLGSGVAEVDCGWVNGRAITFFGFIVDYCGVWTSRRDGVKGKADEVLVFSEHTSVRCSLGLKMN